MHNIRDRDMQREFKKQFKALKKTKKLLPKTDGSIGGKTRYRRKRRRDDADFFFKVLQLPTRPDMRRS